jgi:hypothetical protein
MMRTDKTDPSRKPNSDKFSFDEYARNMDRADLFAPLDDRGSARPLRDFVERELHIRSATSTGGSETIIRGKAFLKQMPSGEYELLISRGRNTYDTYYSYDRNELIQFAQSLQEGE